MRRRLATTWLLEATEMRGGFAVHSSDHSGPRQPAQSRPPPATDILGRLQGRWTAMAGVVEAGSRRARRQGSPGKRGHHHAPGARLSG